MPPKNVSLSIKEKQQIINAVASGCKQIDVSKRFNVPRSTITSILKNKDKITSQSSDSKIKRFKTGDYPQLEDKVKQWFAQARNSNVPVGGNILREKARVFAEKMGIEDFRASDGWFDRFKKRHNIKFKKLSGESASVSDNVCSKWKDELKKIIEPYDNKNIFNADETGLFYKCLPDRSMCFKEEKCHGGKNSKERVTILLAANMDGSEKLKPLMIGKSAKPRCFKNIKSFPMTYRANKKSWMTGELFNEWIQLINVDMKKKQRKILLFIDNCSAHNSIPSLSNVKVVFLPANTTSKLQPLDQGIIKTFKTFYRKEVVMQLLDRIEDGLNHKITLFSAMNIADKAWQNVSETTIKNCFRACGFSKEELPFTDDAEQDVESLLEWDRLSQNEENHITFEDFVHFDDGLAVAGMLTDEEILAPPEDVDGEEGEGDEDDVPIINAKDAKQYVNNVRHFLAKSDVGDEVFFALNTLDRAIDNTRMQGLCQKKITDFF